ncbi:hypothetical protein DB347_11335 [Opitutaceae bacterium EW11]|nr:hypothetical protein DB347_11335 [Opitutaceae bacterium EW11]
MINASSPDYSDVPNLNRTRAFRYSGEADENPRVSIVTPYHNTGAIFLETVESVLQQSLRCWEWIVVDDASTEVEAVRILSQVASLDRRIRIVHMPRNGGPGAARNYGIGQAKSDYVFQLDSDDLIEPVALEILLWYLVSHPNCAFVKGFEVGFGAQNYLWPRGFDDGSKFLDENCVQTNAMVRRSVFQAVGGYDETIRGGCEDWEFWLRCADHGLWGRTVPLYLHWYRRRVDHSIKWANFDAGPNYRRFRDGLHQKFPRLTKVSFPRLPEIWHCPREIPPVELPLTNRLSKASRRLLIIVPHLELGGSDKFNLDLIRSLQSAYSYEVTVATTLASAKHSWMSEFYALTPDVFPLNTFLRVPDYPRFLSYLIESRSCDAVLITHSALGYQLLPFLRSRHPSIPFIDYVHIEELSWKSGGYPRMSVDYVTDLTATVASSRHLRDWMIARGHDETKCSVAYTCVDTKYWSRTSAVGGGRFSRIGGATACRVAFVGRLHEQKRPELLAKIALELQRREWNGTILVAGSGPEEEMFRKFIAEERIRNVVMLGALANSEVRELFASVELLLVPSKNEGIALVLYEAMSMEVVPIMADVGGQSELLNAETGYLIPVCEGELTQYVEAVLDATANPEKRRRMACRGREQMVRSYGIEVLPKQMHELISRATESEALVRPGVSRKVGDTIALEAIEQVRLEILAEWLWTQRSEFLNVVKEKAVAATERVERLGVGGRWTQTIRRKLRLGWRA